MYKVFLTEKIHPDGVKILESIAEVTVGSNIEPATIMKEAIDCDAILIRSASIGRDLMDQLPKLKVIAKHGIGVDNIDVEAATQKGILVVNAPESNINSVAEHAMTMILALSKNLVFMDRKVREGEFKVRNQFPGMEIKGKTVGLIGLGRIAKLLALKLAAFGVNLIAFDTFVTEDSRAFAKKENIILVETIDDLYKNADFISIHVPLNEGTKNLINEEAFRKMKREAYLINVARGHIVNEADLYAALKNNLIRGAALDVFDEEPPTRNHPLFELENIILSPHNAALTSEAMVAMATQSAQGVVDFLSEKQPKYIVNPKYREKQ